LTLYHLPWVLPYQKHWWSRRCNQTSICSLSREQCSQKSFQDHTCGLCLCWLSFVLIRPQRCFHILAGANQSCYC
jgi:hypothetical protein